MLKYRYLKSGTNHTRKQSFADTATLDHQKSPVIVGGQNQASVVQWEVALQRLVSLYITGEPIPLE